MQHFSSVSNVIDIWYNYEKTRIQTIFVEVMEKLPSTSGPNRVVVKERDRSCIVDVAQGAEGSRSAVRDYT
jgi:hypothetical protein